MQTQLEVAPQVPGMTVSPNVAYLKGLAAEILGDNTSMPMPAGEIEEFKRCFDDAIKRMSDLDRPFWQQVVRYLYPDRFASEESLNCLDSDGIRDIIESDIYYTAAARCLKSDTRAFEDLRELCQAVVGF